MRERRADKVIVSKGRFVVLNEVDFPTVTDNQDLGISDEIQELVRSERDQNLLRRHIQRRGRLAAKSWGSHTS